MRWNVPAVRRLATLCVLCLGCPGRAGRSAAADAAPAGVAADARPRAAEQRGAAAAAPAPADSLPSLRVADAPPSKRARELNAEGLRLHRAGDHRGAVDKLREAVTADPTHLLARYNLACAYNRAGEAARGLELLRQLRAAACPACVGILAHAPEDEDWRDRWGDPDFREVTRAAAERVAALSRAAADVAGAWRAGAGARLAPFLAPERQVVLVDVMALCDPSPTETCRREEKLGGARLRRRFSEGAEDYAHNAGKKITCDGRCCSLDGAGEQGDMDTRLERVCFEPDGDALRLVRIEVTSG